MSATRREIYYVAVTTLIALVLHSFTPLFSLVLTLPALLAYTVTAPLFYLGIVALLGELFATQPFGIMTVVVLLPLLIRRVFKGVPVDISVRYFLLVGAAFLIQFLVLFVTDIGLAWQAYRWSPATLGAALAVLPWRIGPFLLVPILVLYGSSILIYFNRRW